MLSIFKRKKVEADKVSLQFAEYFLPAVDEGFKEIAAMINESPEFVKKPGIDPMDSDRFLLITLAANLMSIQRNFQPHDDQEVSRHVLERIAVMCDTDYIGLSNSVGKFQKFISKVNHPSKNLVYGISKTVFFKYGLVKFQEEYFRNINAPNPIFLKRLDEGVVHFLWDWEDVAG